MSPMSYVSSYFHCVFSTKERRRLITPALRERLWPFLGGIARQNEMKAIEIGGVEDHVHLLSGLRATHCLAEFMRELKKASSIWSAENYEEDFSWQDGYAAFSVSWTHLDAVRKYIATQEEHHRKTDFVAELRKLLERNGVRYEEKYLW